MRAATQNPAPIEIFSWARLIQSVLEECCSVTSAFCPHRKEFDIKRSKEFVYKNNSFIERHIIFLPTDRLVGLWYCVYFAQLLFDDARILAAEPIERLWQGVKRQIAPLSIVV